MIRSPPGTRHPYGPRVSAHAQTIHCGSLTGPGPISDVPNYIGSSTWSLQIFLRTPTEFLPSTILTTPSGCFYKPFPLTLRLSVIVGAEEIQGRSSGVAVIRPVNLLQTSTSIQRKNKPSARWEATSEFDPDPPVANGRYRATPFKCRFFYPRIFRQHLPALRILKPSQTAAVHRLRPVVL